MSLRDQLLFAAKRAAEVLEETAARRRVLENGYTRIDPVAIAEGDGVPVMLRPLEKLLGAFLRSQDSAGILVNSQRPIGMLHMTCAHELGHHFLGHDTKTDEELDFGDTASPEERAANEFAYHLLMPRWLVVHVMNRKGWGVRDLKRADVVYQLSLRLGVSFTAMTWSLNRIKLLAPDLARQISQTPPKLIKEAALAAGAPVPSGGDVWVLDQGDQDFVVEPRVSDRFVVRLPSHASAGFVWTADEATAAGFTIRPAVVNASHLGRPMEPVVVGSGGSISYLLEPNDIAARSDDVLPVDLGERQPWTTDAPRDQFRLHARYERIFDGLSKGSRQRLIREMA